MKTYLLIIHLIFSIGLYSQTPTRITKNDLPQNLALLLSKKYRHYQLINITKNESNYNIKLQNKQKIVYLVSDSSGNIITTKKNKEFTFDGSEKEKIREKESEKNTAMPPPAPPF